LTQDARSGSGARLSICSKVLLLANGDCPWRRYCECGRHGRTRIERETQ
jgi:hypothetical protein